MITRLLAVGVPAPAAPPLVVDHVEALFQGPLAALYKVGIEPNAVAGSPAVYSPSALSAL